ncbi:DUF5666 domain-containing protein [Marinagarivorans algicola]|uniref:DUF5666 domain-containing protein n=1 Tax=Marinagarivorans algicola TaxID=1513270 RepID=UPI0006B946D6|nr:DUF5666 domain-containing protein [Marinagarivorans algicola]
MKNIHSKLILATAITAAMAGCTGTSETTANIDTPLNDQAKTVAITAIGEIDGFGSVIVNGVHYDTDTAEVTIDGEPATEDELDVGMVVEVDGEKTDKKGAKANRIRFFSKVAGQVETVDSDAQTLTVMGKTVLIDGDTKLDDAIDSVTLAPLAQGVVVRVSGRTNADDQIVATRIDIRQEQTNTQQRLSGIVSSLNTSNGNTFSLEGKNIEFASANLVGDELTDGVRVLVRGETIDGVLVASKVVVITQKKRPTNNEKDSQRKKRVEIKGKLVKKEGKEHLEIDGRPVKNIDNEDIKNGDKDDIKAGELVTIKGDVNADGSIDVDSVKRELAATLRMMGNVEEVDTQTGEMTVNGKKYRLQDDTDYSDKEAKERYFNMENITPGDTVVVDGFKDKQGKRIVKSVTRINKKRGQDKKQSGRLHTTLSAVNDGLLTTADGVMVVIQKYTVITKSVDLTTIALGEDGDKLLISGTYNADGELEAKHITSLRTTPSKDDMPRAEQAPEDKLKDIEDRVTRLEERLKKERERPSKERAEKADKEVGQQDIEERIKDIEDRVKDHQHVMDKEDTLEMADKIERMKHDVEMDFDYPEAYREAVIEKFEVLLLKLTEAGDTKGVAHIEEILANLAEVDDMVEEREHTNGMETHEKEMIEDEIDDKLENIKDRVEEKYAHEDMMGTPKMPKERDCEVDAIAKIEATIAKIEALDDLSENEKALKLEKLNVILASLKAAQNNTNNTSPKDNTPKTPKGDDQQEPEQEPQQDPEKDKQQPRDRNPIKEAPTKQEPLNEESRPKKAPTKA